MQHCALLHIQPLLHFRQFMLSKSNTDCCFTHRPCAPARCAGSCRGL